MNNRINEIILELKELRTEIYNISYYNNNDILLTTANNLKDKIEDLENELKELNK